MKIKCLIIDDTAFLRELYRFTLRSEENILIVDEAVDGMDALVKLKSIQPDLVILDLILPLKNGLEVLKQMGSISPQSRCLVVSSIDEPAIIDSALALGAIKYLTKPFTKNQLLDAVHEVIKSYGEVAHG